MSKHCVRRRLTGFFLAAVLYLCSLPLSAGAAPLFSDVPENAWFTRSILSLVEQGIVSGTGNGRFSPDAPLTRGAFVTMLARSYLTPAQYNDYAFQGPFKDVSVNGYANPFINWAWENGVVSGVSSTSFAPERPVTRQEMAVMVVNFANTVGRVFPHTADPLTFSDDELISPFAREAVAVCQQAGVLNGYKDGTFRPRHRATRGEAAVLTQRFLSSCLPAEGFALVARRVNGVAVNAVTLDPSLYTADLITGRDVADGAETVSSIIDRTGAFIAMNGVFFDMNSYQALGTLIRGGEVVTTFERFSPDKPALTVDANGRFAIQHFTTSFTVEYVPQSLPEPEPDAKPLEEDAFLLTEVGVNRWPVNDQDSTRLLFTRAWGHDLAFQAKYAITIGPDGTVLSVDHDANVEIPEGCMVLAQRAARPYDSPIYRYCQPGDTLTVTRKYTGLTANPPVVSMGAGPRLLKDGAVYGDLATYAAEGFSNTYITLATARRVGVGIRPNGSVVLLTADCNLTQFSKIFLALGCSDAINFDGGGSTNLYAGGFWAYGPQSRRVNTALVFYKK